MSIEDLNYARDPRTHSGYIVEQPVRIAAGMCGQSWFATTEQAERYASLWHDAIVRPA